MLEYADLDCLGMRHALVHNVFRVNIYRQNTSSEHTNQCLEQIRVLGYGSLSLVSCLIESDAKASIRVIYESILDMSETNVRDRLVNRLRPIALTVIDREVLIYVHWVEELLIRCFALVTDLILGHVKLELLIHVQGQPSLVVLTVYRGHGE